MESPARAIARQLAAHAQAVCAHYLSNGRRDGRYWLVGDVNNTAGRSLYVRLTASADGKHQPGKWADAQSGEHGDLLDIIAVRCGHVTLRETLDEARQFLKLPLPAPDGSLAISSAKAQTGSREAAVRLWKASKPIIGSTAQSYLQSRGLVDLPHRGPLRFHPRCYYRRSSDDAPDVRTEWPAMISAITDDIGDITGVHRTWLDPAGFDKAPVACPRRAMGNLLANGVRFGPPAPVMAAGEGIETILSVRQIMPNMSAIAGLSATHLAAISFPQCLRRLYVACDDDAAGAGAFVTLVERASASGINVLPLHPEIDDFNSDLQILGREHLLTSITSQLEAADAEQFLER